MPFLIPIIIIAAEAVAAAAVAVAEVVVAVATTIGEGIAAATAAIGDFAAAAAGTIGDGLSAAGTAIGDAASSVGSAIGDAATSIGDTLGLGSGAADAGGGGIINAGQVGAAASDTITPTLPTSIAGETVATTAPSIAPGAVSAGTEGALTAGMGNVLGASGSLGTTGTTSLNAIAPLSSYSGAVAPIGSTVTGGATAAPSMLSSLAANPMVQAGAMTAVGDGVKAMFTPNQIDVNNAQAANLQQAQVAQNARLQQGVGTSSFINHNPVSGLINNKANPNLLKMA